MPLMDEEFASDGRGERSRGFRCIRFVTVLNIDHRYARVDAFLLANTTSPEISTYQAETANDCYDRNEYLGSEDLSDLISQQ
jgi:hypothetical protein